MRKEISNVKRELYSQPLCEEVSFGSHSMLCTSPTYPEMEEPDENI